MKPTKQYSNSGKYTGKPKVNKHPGSNPEGASDEPFSATATVDANTIQRKQINNLATTANHQKSMPITDKNPYKRQSHAVKPSGPIQSFVGNRVDSNPGKMPPTKRPKGNDGDY